ncbi:16S rRNA (guanine(966)-N(2))-methyltransferase RsmD [Texcoconibacillus texcoconensis]|uniref:16S rRNA (Guanine(966)-N(2))-methyltransferase RsmD n=1 Tax=Texcoconibacillus texcoconensis TaxID=1095777 RepID=A0A840QLG0_9BACI|nr:16S rRNA (guanine(966)-N(2))-methyltransferase RsmD [Texcoconibacillus texcoconensis]MBB5172197.1 16S rRNA (guanine(966)-N(2))-methyltransferase RsmD [Texcoconibacillus texcoconensis]
MRVISGSEKGVKLKTLQGHTTRPTTDKVKEAMFNRIGPYFHEGKVLDLYAGSGGLGIEALSRGCDFAIFVEKDSSQYRQMVENIRACRFESKSETYRNDATRALKAASKRGLRFDYVFLDPPYHRHRLSETLTKLSSEGLVNDEGLVIVEHVQDVHLQGTYEKLEQIHNDRYGDTVVTIFQMKEEE